MYHSLNKNGNNSFFSIKAENGENEKTINDVKNKEVSPFIFILVVY
jgi:hypothetical protein